MKTIIGLFLFALLSLSAENLSTPKLFGKVINIDNNDILNVRQTANYRSRKVGSLTSGILIGVEKCKKVGRSIWCQIHPLAGHGGDFSSGWVNARFLSFSNKGYVTVENKTNNCFYALKCKNNNSKCLVVLDYNTDREGNIVNLTQDWIDRETLYAESKFGAIIQNSDGYCSSGMRINDYLKSHSSVVNVKKQPTKKHTTLKVHVIHVAENDMLSIRKKPNIKSIIVGKLHSNQIFFIDSCKKVAKSNWCRTKPQYGDVMRGWVNAHYIEDATFPSSPSSLAEKRLQQLRQEDNNSSYKKVISLLENFLPKYSNREQAQRIKKIIHPIKGILLTDLVQFENEYNHTYYQHDFVENYLSNRILHWGYTYGRGDALKKSLKEYFNGLHKDIKDITRIDAMGLRSFPCSENRTLEAYEVYWIDEGSDVAEYSYLGLLIIIEEYRGKWYIVGLMRDRWTI